MSDNNGRQTILRVAPIDTLNPRKLDAAFMFVHSQFDYSLKSIYRPLVSQGLFDLGEFPNTFPHTISEYYWIQEGEATIRPWIALGKLESGLYFYYVGYCNDKSGLFYLNKKKMGIMHLWVSINVGDLINWAMDADSYKKYTSETSSEATSEAQPIE